VRKVVNLVAGADSVSKKVDVAGGRRGSYAAPEFAGSYRLQVEVLSHK
jgi:hypothetical protein